jgi:hypothetical protein
MPTSAAPTTRDRAAHAAVAELLDALEARLPDVVAAACARERDVAPELAALPRADVAGALHDALTVAAELALVAMRSPSSAPRELPDVLGALTQLAAQHELPGEVVVRMLRATHAALLDAALDVAEAQALELVAVERVSRHLFVYIDALAAQVSAAHAAERRRVSARPEKARLARVRAVLEGSDQLGLPYPLEGRHVALVLRGARSRALLRATIERVGAPWIATEEADGTLWAWTSCALCEGEVVGVLRELRAPGCTVGVSGHESGVEGFRNAHRKAWLALQLGRRRGTAVTTFGDIALEALAFGGEQMAREFVRAEMGPLLHDSPRVAAMRQTLAAYFELGSAAAAGREVGVSERAVVYRLRHAERLLERPLTKRRAELETALRLHDMFGAQAKAA